MKLLKTKKFMHNLRLLFDFRIKKIEVLADNFKA